MSRRIKNSTASPLLTGPTRKLRCAIYTRVSTDEQTNLEYNSLHAQRDACEAFTASQRAEGWTLVDDRYDDGGYSGGTLDRPALNRLKRDIEAGLVDVIVVHRTDRLSRSLADFLLLLELFERHGVTFVSVTQSFNTTTSVGRLFLNILLSFSQYERELIGERIRDKFAASRARGLWMGGKVPLGYEVRNRKLVVNETEAAIVLRVFELFSQTGSGVETLRRLSAEGRTARNGRAFNRADLYRLLNNCTYVGQVTHKGQTFPGEHNRIVAQDLWNGVHTILQESPRARANKNRQSTPALLKGLIFGVDGRALSATHTRRRGRFYRYYVAQTVLKDADAAVAVRRVSAAAIETAVIAQVRKLLLQPEIIVGTWLAARSEAPDLTEDDVREALKELDPVWNQLFPVEQARIIRLLVERVVVGPDGADIRLRVEGLTTLVQDLRGGTAKDAA